MVSTTSGVTTPDAGLKVEDGTPIYAVATYVARVQVPYTRGKET